MAVSTTAFMLPRFFVQTHIFFVSPSSFRVSSRYSNQHHQTEEGIDEAKIARLP